MYKGRQRQGQGQHKGRQDLKLLQDRVARIETLLPCNGTDQTSPRLPPNTVLDAATSLTPNKRTQEQSDSADPGITRLENPEPNQSVLIPPMVNVRVPVEEGPQKKRPRGVAEDVQPMCQTSEMPPVLQVSPTSVLEGVQLPPTPSVTATTNIAEDDGSCYLPPEQEVCPPLM